MQKIGAARGGRGMLNSVVGKEDHRKEGFMRVKKGAS